MTAYISTTYAADGQPATEVVAELIDAGIQHIELGSTHVHEPTLLARLRALRATYLVHNYFPPPPQPFVVNLASADPAARERSLRHALGCVAFTAELGAALYTFHPGFLGDPQGPAHAGTGSLDFVFDESTPAEDPATTFERCVEAAGVLAAAAGAAGVRVAVESEGSVAKRDRVLLQTPQEFAAFFRARPEEALGVNVNLGHLHLASRAFGFDPFDFIDGVAARVAAFELSHNDGREDQHRPPEVGAWYWPVLRDPRFASVPVIVECRAAPLTAVLEAYQQVAEARAQAARSERP